MLHVSKIEELSVLQIDEVNGSGLVEDVQVIAQNMYEIGLVLPFWVVKAFVDPLRFYEFIKHLDVVDQIYERE